MKRLPRGFWWFTLAFLLITSLPYAVGFLNAPAGGAFTGNAFEQTRVDFNSHLAKIEQGREGAWTQHILFTPEEHPGLFINPLYFYPGAGGPAAGAVQRGDLSSGAPDPDRDPADRDRAFAGALSGRRARPLVGAAAGDRGRRGGVGPVSAGPGPDRRAGPDRVLAARCLHLLGGPDLPALHGRDHPAAGLFPGAGSLAGAACLARDRWAGRAESGAGLGAALRYAVDRAGDGRPVRVGVLRAAAGLAGRAAAGDRRRCACPGGGLPLSSRSTAIRCGRPMWPRISPPRRRRSTICWATCGCSSRRRLAGRPCGGPGTAAC